MTKEQEEELKLQRQLNPTVYVGEPEAEDKELMAQIDASKADNTAIKLPRKVVQPTVEQLIPIAEKTTQEVIQAVDEKTANDNPGSLRSKMGESIKFFAPDLVGAAIGGLFGGVEGAFGGIQTGGQIRKDLTEYELNQQKLRQSNQRLNRFQRSEEIIDSLTQEPLNYDPITGTYKNQKGEVVPADRQINLKAVREGRLEGQGSQRIDIARANTQLRDLSLKDKMGEDTSKKMVSAIKALESNKIYKDADAALSEVSTIKNLVDDAVKKGGQSLAMLGPKIAKGIAGEVGVLTEQDVTRYVKNPSLVGGLMDTLAKMKSGKLTGASAENIKRLLDIMEKEALRKKQTKVNQIAKQYAGTTEDFDANTLKQVLDPNANSDIDLKRKRLEELRKKAGR